MNDLPFAIPQSLSSYLFQFEDAPDKTVKRLSAHLKKRGPDPVGYFLLAWFYYCKGLPQEAQQIALKARNFAPGSPFFEKLPYYFSHPNLFGAWHPKNLEQSTREPQHHDGMIGDLNTLIEKLSAIERSDLKQADLISATDINRNETNNSDDIVSETLATIHGKQHNFDTAIEIYKKLKHRYPEKKSTYNRQINQLEKQKAESEKE